MKDQEELIAFFDKLNNFLIESNGDRLTAKERKQQNNLKDGLPKNSGIVWSDKDKNELALSIEAEDTISKISKKLKRSTTAVLAEIKRQEKEAKEIEEIEAKYITQLRDETPHVEEF